MRNVARIHQVGQILCALTGGCSAVCQQAVVEQGIDPKGPFAILQTKKPKQPKPQTKKTKQKKPKSRFGNSTSKVKANAESPYR